jgi:hypothetical protein
MLVKGANVLKEHKLRNLEFKPDLQQINFLDRRVYKRGDDLYYPSVTSILSYMPKNKFFENWIKDVGHNADVIMRRAAEEGTAVHNAVEDLVAGKEITWMDDFGNAKYSLDVWNMILKAYEFFETYKPEIIASEYFTYSDEHQYAGTTDLVLKLNDVVWLVDIKTSNSVHKSHELQLAAYAKAWEEVTGQKIEKTGILWLKSSKRTASKKEGIYQGKGWEIVEADDTSKNFELFKLIYELYKIDHPTTEPIYNSYPTSIKLS